MKKEELIKVQGGAPISATMINAVARCLGALYDLGRALGTGIRMIRGKNYC